MSSLDDHPTARRLHAGGPKDRTDYVAKGTDVANHVARRFPHKHARFVRPSGRATNVSNFLAGIRLSCNPERRRSSMQPTISLSRESRPGPRSPSATVSFEFCRGTKGNPTSESLPIRLKPSI
jgi:hypothetical protein